MDPVNISQADAYSPLFLRIYDQSNEAYLDVSPATTVITAQVRQKYTDDVLETITLTKVFPELGFVRLDWTADMWDDLDVGRYEVEITVDVNGDEYTVGRFYWSDNEREDEDVLPIRLQEDF